MSERIAKFMARSGVCSRREAEELIRQKRVTVNGEIVASPIRIRTAVRPFLTIFRPECRGSFPSAVWTLIPKGCFC